MRVRRTHLNVLLNRLYDRGDDVFTISHPSETVGKLVEISLDAHDESTIRFSKDKEAYAEARNDVGRKHPKQLRKDLPDPSEYVNAAVASGILPIENDDDVKAFLDRYGDPDLMAGHHPVVAGFDTNLMPWRIDRLLGLREPSEGLGYVNGILLATGVRDELDWEYKCHDTKPFVDAWGESFEEYWNQSLGSARKGRLGLLAYRSLRDIQQAEEIISEEGDDNILETYDEFDQERKTDVILFSNDRNFVEGAQSRRLLGQRIEFPSELPRKTTASWNEIELLIYYFAILFGIVEVPSVTVHGIWRGKDQHDWQHERVKLDCRSPKLQSELEGDLSIVESYEEFVEDNGQK